MREISLTGSAPGRFEFKTFAVVTVLTAAVLFSLVAIPQWLSKQARLEGLGEQVGEVARLAASVVDGDLHHKFRDKDAYSDALYAEAVKPLVRFHSADPDIHYLYTMAEIEGEAYFILDTATSGELRTERELEASEYLEKFEPRETDDWLSQIAAGKTYVTPDFEEDDYGTFLSAHAPIYDSDGRYSGFVGVDYDLQYYLAREARFSTITQHTLAAAVILSLIVGCLIAQYRGVIKRRVHELYLKSVTDSLTGLLNRRGLLEVTRAAGREKSSTSAILLIDVDGLRLVNTLRGHTTGDAMLATVAQTIRDGLVEGDHCARIGSEFVVFAPRCDATRAEAIARSIHDRLRSRGMAMVGCSFSASIGIAVSSESFDFAEMYREASQALGQAKAEGAGKVGIIDMAPAA
ncbi:MAG TPA: diguanylate cyclase [Methyloceanibacter sp.]|nr:diguanylate cyclase [Methyloceanibacter sp.]